MITVDRLNKTVIGVDLNRPKNTIKHARKKWYNRKSPRGAKKIKTMINFLYNEKKEGERIFFATITTCQHKSGISDYECNRRVGLWLKNRSIDYVCVLERQTKAYSVITRFYGIDKYRCEYTGQQPTEDIHYHIVLLTKLGERFDIRSELQKLGRLFEVEPHPALFDIKELKDVRRVVGYIRKYVTKSNGEFTSLYRCRTFTISRGLGKRYKQNAHKYVRRIGATEQSKPALYEFMKRCKHILVEKKFEIPTNFFKAYEYNDQLWNAARELTPQYEEMIYRLEETNMQPLIGEGERPVFFVKTARLEVPEISSEKVGLSENSDFLSEGR